MAGCACLDKPLPCLVQDTGSSASPFDQPLSVQVGTEYELDWSLFPGLKEWTPEKAALVIRPDPAPEPTRVSPYGLDPMSNASPKSNFLLQQQHQRLQEQRQVTPYSGTSVAAVNHLPLTAIPQTMSYAMPTTMSSTNAMAIPRTTATVNVPSVIPQNSVPHLSTSTLAYTPVRGNNIRQTQQYTPTSRLTQTSAMSTVTGHCQCPNCTTTPVQPRNRSRLIPATPAGTMPSTMYGIKGDPARNWDYLSLYNQQSTQGVHYFTPPRQVAHVRIPQLQQLTRSAPMVAHRRLKVIPAVQNLAALSAGPMSPQGSTSTFPAIVPSSRQVVHGHSRNVELLPYQNTISYYPEQQQPSSLFSHQHYLQSCLENQTLDYFPDMKRKLDVDFSLSDPFQDAKRRKLAACFVDHVSVRDNAVQVNRQLIRGY